MIGKPLGFVASLSYNRSYGFYNDGYVGRYRLVGSNSESLNNESYYRDSFGEMDVLWGGLVNLSYKFSNNHKLGFNVLYNHNGTKVSRFMFGEVRSDGSGRLRETRTLKFTERYFTSYQLKGENYFPNTAMLKIDWLSSFSVAGQDEPDLRFFTNSLYPDQEGDARYSVNTSEYAGPARYYRTMDEYNWDNKIDFSLPFNYRGLRSKFKFGGAYVYKKREFIEKRMNFTTQQSESYNGSTDDYFKDKNIGQAGTDPLTGAYGIYVQNSTDEDDRNSYNADELVFATFLMLDIPVTVDLRMILGGRVEKTLINTRSFNPSKPEGHLDNFDFLPSLNLTYSLNENMNLRAAYSTTLARPSFRELAPYASFEFQGGYVTVGNENIRRTLVQNIDFRWEYFMKPGEIISIGTFYKDFKNPIERTFNPEAGNDELTWRNVDKAQVYGAEIEVKKRLDMLYGLRNLQLGLNYSYVYSQVQLDERELDVIRATEPGHPDNRPMFGQSPYIVNAMLTYNNDSLGLETNLSFNITGRRLSYVNLGGTPDVYEQPRPLLNFNISKRFSGNCYLRFIISNILDSQHNFAYSRY